MRAIPALAADESGQSILEFMFLAPVIVGIAMIMMRVNSAIQISIVNQQYARAQATWLAFNYSIFPELKLRQRDFYPKNYNEMIIGISKNAPSAAQTDGGDAGDQYQPHPMIQDIRRTPTSQQGVDDPSLGQDQNPKRSQVRVRTTVALCTQPMFSAGGPVLSYAKDGSVGTYGLKDDQDQFNGVLCNSPYLSSLGGS